MTKALKRIFSIFLILFCLYCSLGFLILPGIALRIINQQLAQYYNEPAEVQRLEFNPLTLQLTAWNIRLGTIENPQLLLDRLQADLHWSTLWTGLLQLSTVALDAPRLALHFDSEGRLNLVEALNLPASEPSEDTENTPFPLRIDHIQLNNGQLHFQDQRPAQEVDFVLDAINVELHNLSTLPDDSGALTLAANTADGGNITWQGDLDLAAYTSTGHLDIQKLSLPGWWPYAERSIPLRLDKGEISLTGDYRLDFSHELQLTTENIAIQLRDLAINAATDKPLTQLAALDIGNARFDLGKQQILIGQIQGQGLEAWATREKDGEIDWQKIFATPASASTPTSEPTSPAATETETETKPWQLQIDQIALRNYRFHLEDRQPDQPVTLLLGPLDLDISGLDTAQMAPVQVKLDTGFGKLGHLQANGKVGLEPLSAQLAVTSKDIDLRLAQAYLAPFIHLELRSGFLDSHLAIDLHSIEPLAFSVNGDVDVNQLHTLDAIKQHDLLKWKKLMLNGLSYQHEKSLTINAIHFDEPYARFIINDDHTTNIDDLLIAQPETPTATPNETQPPLAIKIGGITVDNGSANFADRSLIPPFGTAIQELEGKIGQLDTQAPDPADVSIQGKVDKYAPVNISGYLDPFDYLKKLDITASFKNVDLTTLTPYSGKFAGYRIRKGRLGLDLHYQIESGQLEAENKVLLQQLQLGEKVESPDAVDLPVKLAVALLKDTKGDINIQLPVKGDLNDPEFSVMPIVWQTLRNLVLRAVQSPFKLITGLADSEADHSTVVFAAGSSELTDKDKSQLQTLVKALNEHPSLILEVEGVSSIGSDGPFVAERRLHQEYQTLYYKMLQQRGDKVPEHPNELEVPENMQAALLEGIYRNRLGQQPPAEWQELDKATREKNMQDALLDQWSGNTGLLRRLAQQRAARIKDFLAEHGLDNERIFLIDAAISKEGAGNSIASRLHLDSQ